MRPILRTIWVLVGLLVIGAVDALPDPPAVNPGTPVCQILQQHSGFDDAAVPPRDGLDAVPSFALQLVASDGPEPYRPIRGVVLCGQASNTSPPAQRSERARFLQAY
jgi:hypothetical protein